MSIHWGEEYNGVANRDQPSPGYRRRRRLDTGAITPMSYKGWSTATDSLRTVWVTSSGITIDQ